MNDEEFKFDVDAPLRRVADDAILWSLREFIEEQKSDQVTTIAYDAWPAKVCTAATVSKRFGGWRTAMARAGVTTKIRSREYSVGELLDNLERVWRQFGRPPGKRTLAKCGMGISERPYVRRWGSVKNACRLLAQYKNGEITEDNLLGKKPASSRKTIPLRVRWDVMKRGNYMCAKCGARPPDVSLDVDHILPLAQDGTDAITNLQVLCSRCNQGKKARME